MSRLAGRPAVTTRSGRVRSVLGAVGLLLAAAGCGSGSATGEQSPRGGGSSSAGGLTGSITVYAAASLKATFTQIGADVERAHPGTKVTFNFAGSSDLVAQIQQGAPADVFASADTRNMDKVTGDALTAAAPVNFATNTLQIAVPPGNPARISSFRDLAKPVVKVVVCAPAVPCGAATVTVQNASKVTLTPVSEEQSVTDVLGKVIAGEADAGMVYVTDVRGAGSKVEGVAFPESSAAVNTYPIATIKASRNPALAEAFVRAVTGDPGQGVLAAAGFGQP